MSNEAYIQSRLLTELGGAKGASKAYTHQFLTDAYRNLRCTNSSRQCGNACVPQSKKCRQNVEGLVEKIEDKIKSLDYERVVVVTSNGKIPLVKGGGRSEVGFTEDEFKLFKGNIVTHNHPNLGWRQNDPRAKGLSFSPADLQAACVGEVRELRAVTRDYRHSLKPPPGGWNEKYWKESVEPAYRYHQRQVYQELSNKLFWGRINRADAEAVFPHEVMKRTAAQAGFHYARSEY